MNTKAWFAEFIGTLGLTFAVLVSLNNPNFPVATPIVAALTLGLFVYTLGHVSGTHLNPAITIGIASIGKITIPDAIGYLISQFLGAFVAALAAQYYFPTLTLLAVENTTTIGIAELIGAAIFALGVGTVVVGRVSGAVSGFVVGLSLLLGISFAAPFSNGVLNPAVAFGIGSFSLAYIWGPIVGAICGMFLARYFAGTGFRATAATFDESVNIEVTRKKMFG